MNENFIIAIGKCININLNYLHIHFKGYYHGSYIKRIVVQNVDYLDELFVGKEYIFYLKNIEVSKSELISELIYFKEINDPI